MKLHVQLFLKRPTREGTKTRHSGLGANSTQVIAESTQEKILWQKGEQAKRLEKYLPLRVRYERSQESSKRTGRALSR